MVNWQDREHPQAGGAEIHLHEIFGRLASDGHEVTLLCGGWRGAPPRARLDGIDVRRVGTRATFGALAWRAYRAELRGVRHDVLVEDMNKIPLFTPLWRPPRVVALVPHLFGATVFEELPLPLASAVWLAERPLASVYRRTPFQAISESTAADLVARGIGPQRIRVILPGVDATRLTPCSGSRSPTPRFAYLGRLKRYKRVDLIIRAFARLTRSDAMLEIAGTGDHRPALERLARSLDLGGRVQFLGFISEEDKLALLRRVWSVVLTSPKEGWGITNLEAAACGTPAVASDSPGLRESVRDGETGFLVPHANVAALAGTLERLASSPALVEELGTRARRFAESFTWRRAADETADHLASLVRDGGNWS